MDRYFEGETFDKQDVLILSEGEYIHCSFVGMDFSGESFKSSKIIDCSFKSCNLSNIELTNATVMNTEFDNCKLVGTNWTSVNRVSHPRFTACLLDFSIMQDLDLTKVEFEKCSLKDVDFSGAKLNLSHFKEANLENAVFNQCDLQQANFIDAVNYWIDPRYNKLKGAKFSMPNAITLFEAMGIEIVA